MKILVTGANGFLGHYLVQQLLAANVKLIATGKGDCRLPFKQTQNFVYHSLDFTDPFAVHDLFEKIQPHVVVHAGAMSKVDDCEQNQWQCYVVNTEGTLTLLSNAEECKSHFIFVSTDFVFDGLRPPYNETAEYNPVNFYGKSKRDAEEAVKEYPFDWTIVRTSLVYGKPTETGSNILSVVKQKLASNENYSVFNDQVRTPTYVGDLASAIKSIIDIKAKGIFHIAGKDVLTPYDMACKAADYLNLDKSLIKKITVDDWKQIAKRPVNTVFDLTKAKKFLHYQPISFEEGIKKTFAL
jgi:dTDP-4-dehydrorhamnose reductase